MNIARRVVATLAALVAVGACADGRGALDPATPASDLSAAAAHQVEAAGDFDAIVDFTTVSFTPRGSNCLLVVEGALVFTGTIEGTASGVTSALVFAPCEDVSTTPPGTYRDVFRSELEFEGTVNGGELTHAKVLYQGGVEVGGEIDAHIIFSNGIAGVLDASAIVAEGGTYRGSVVVK